MGAATWVFLIIFVIIAYSLFSSQLNSIYDDGKSILRDNSVSIDKPADGAPVYDLQMDVKIKAKGSSNFGLEYLLFLNTDGGTFDKKWINPHVYQGNLLSFLYLANFMDFMSSRTNTTTLTDLTTNEIIIIPNSGVVPVNFKLSYILVDSDTGLQKKLTKYQDVPYSIPALVSSYTIDQKLLIPDLPKKNYELWIIPTTNSYDANIRFADHAVGEKYVQRISP